MSSLIGKIHMSFIFFIACWLYRLFRIYQIISSGHLFDFKAYYLAARELLAVSPHLDVVAKTTYGPPFVLLPFIPFSLLPFNIAEYAITILNLISWFLVFYLLWKKCVEKTSGLFWFLLGSSAFSFPLIFSFTMGNPAGFVALGIYGFFIFKNKFVQFALFTLSWLLKIFPLVAVIPQIIKHKKSTPERTDTEVCPYKINIQSIAFLLFSVLFVILISIVIFPINSWATYLSFAADLKSRLMIPDPAIYNQSFSSFFARIGISIPSFSVWHVLFTAVLFVVLLKKYHRLDVFDVTITFVAFVLLIHPFPWQHYFTVFLPYLFVKIGQKDYKFIFIYFLMSLNWGSSQFLATIILFFLIIFHISVNSPSIRVNPKHDKSKLT